MTKSTFWGTRKKPNEPTEQERKLKAICEKSTSYVDFKKNIDVWRKTVAKKETLQGFMDRCYMKAVRLGYLTDMIKKRTWFAELPQERQDKFKKDWNDISGFPNLTSLLYEYPEAKSVTNLQKTAREYCNPPLPNRLLLRVQAKGREIKAPDLIPRQWSKPPVLEISKEAWERPGIDGKLEVRVGAFSRIDWKSKGARAGLIIIESEIFVQEGCHYNELIGGLVDKKDIEIKIREELNRHTSAQRKRFGTAIQNYVLQEKANELNSIIPFIKKPSLPDKPDRTEFVRLYISTSLILDGNHGEMVAKLLMKMRPDIRLQKQGSNRTRLKGVGATEEERKKGQEIQWVTLRKHRLPGQFASTGVDADVREERAAAESLPVIYIHGGLGASFFKPGGGERDISVISLPVSCVPMPRQPGEPSVALNQIGCTIFHASIDGEEKRVETWSLRDLVTRERDLVTGIKDGATDLHRKIVEALKEEDDRAGLYVGELSDRTGASREEIERAIPFLIEPKSLKRSTWPGLYQDEDSGRISFHNDWFQDRVRFPSLYGKPCLELRRLLFGCFHAGYNTTDYEFVRRRFPQIILDLNINIVELIGDIIAGLKHHLIHRGQIIGNINYTEQEIFAGEILGTDLYEVFETRILKMMNEKGSKPTQEELDQWIALALVLFLYIVGNHDAWQEENGHTPGVAFRNALITVLHRQITKFLWSHGLFTPNLDDILRAKHIELPAYEAVYTFPGGVSTELHHPGMARTKTVSIRAEEALDYSRCNFADIANFHTGIVVHKWHPKLGQCVAVQAGAMTPMTYFEHGKLKRVDFGPVFAQTFHRNGRIFRTMHQFFNEPILKKPRDKNMDIGVLKRELKIFQAQP